MSLLRSIRKTLPVLAVAAAGSQAFGATLTVNVPVAIPASATYGPHSTNYSVAVPQFDPTKGTLTAANLSINVTSGVDIYDIPFFFFPAGTAFKTSVTSQNVYLSQPSDVSYPSVDTTSAVDLESAAVSPDPYTGFAPANGNYVYVGTIYAQVTGSYDVSGSNLASLTGTGSTAIGYNASVDSPITYNYGGGRLDSTVGAQSGTETVTYTYEINGDANLDDKVDLSDLNIVLNHLGEIDSSRADGNFDGAATIDLTDLNDVLNNLGVSAASGSAVVAPEPASLSLLAVGGLMLVRRRSSRKH